MSDDDRAAEHAGRRPATSTSTCGCSTSTPTQHRMHYDVVANGVLWFLHHGLFDRARRPRFDLRFRDAWDAFVAVNQRFADAVAETRDRGRRSCSCRTTSSRSSPGSCARSGPTCGRALHAHAVRRARRPLAAPHRRRRRPLRGAGVGSGGLPHQALGRVATAQSARAVLGRARRDHRRRSPRASAPTSPRSKRSRRRPRRAPRRAARRRGRRPARDRAHRPHRAVEEHRARLPRVRPAARSAARAARAASCSSRWCTRRARASPSTSRTRTRSSRPSARVNERWATRDWTPILLDDRDDFARSVAGLQRYDVLLVNPIRDGLNLVAKEGPVVNRRDGVLCLSPEAGAYDELKSAAIAVHPYDLEQCAGALDDALVDAARRTGGARRRSCARSRRCAHPPTGSPTSSRHAGKSARRSARPGRRRARRPRSRARAAPRSTAHRCAPRAEPAVGDGAGQRGERGQIAVSSPANAATSKPSIERVRPHRPCRRRSAAAARPPCACAARRGRGGRAISARSRAISSARSGAGRQCSVTLIPDFGSTSSRRQPRFELRGRGGHRVEIRLERAGRPSTRRRRLLHAVQARRARDRRPGSCAARNSTGRPLTIPTRPSRAGEACEHRPASGQRTRVVGAFDDRRQRSVEVDEEHGAFGMLGQRGNRCVGIEHGGTLPAWTRRPRPRQRRSTVSATRSSRSAIASTRTPS